MVWTRPSLSLSTGQNCHTPDALVNRRLKVKEKANEEAGPARLHLLQPVAVFSLRHLRITMERVMGNGDRSHRQTIAIR